MARRAARVSTQVIRMSTMPSVFSVKSLVEAHHFSPQKRFSLLAMTSDLYRPISDWEKGCLTQLVEEIDRHQRR